MMTNALKSEPEFQFLTATGPFRVANDEESRRIVRTHAIRDANRRKRLGVQLDKATASPTPVPQSRLTMKFRLDSKPPLASKSKAETSRRKAGNVPQADSDILNLKRASKSRRVSKIEVLREEEEKELPESAQLSPKQVKESILGLLMNGDLDPFDTFSIKFGPKQQALMHYQKVALKQNAFAFFSEDQLFAQVAVDPAWLNATLSLIALHKDLKVGKGISQDCLFHRGEALRLVNERLAVSPRWVEDATIGAIASLASFDVRLWNIFEDSWVIY